MANVEVIKQRCAVAFVMAAILATALAWSGLSLRDVLAALLE